MTLWQEGKDQFVASLRKQRVDEQTIEQFLLSYTGSKDAIDSCEALDTDSQKKYRPLHITKKVTIPRKWICRIMDNIGKFVAAGDIAIQGAPETIGIAWWAIKQVLNAMQNNYKLYTFFSQALTNITEMMVLIRSIDRLYDKRKSSGWTGASEIVESLFSKIRDVYEAILDFSYSVKSHIKAGKMEKLGHAIKDMFGVEFPEFDGKMTHIQELKVSIIERSTNAYQAKTFEELGEITGQLQDVANDMVYFKEALDMEKQSSQVMKELYEALAWSKPKSIRDIALQEFEANKTFLNPLPETREALNLNFEARAGDTCEWIFDLDKYTAWRDSGSNEILCVTGEAGSGKSVLLSSVVQRLRAELQEKSEYVVQYLFCDRSGSADESTNGVQRIQNTLICQLYEVALLDEGDSTIQACNRTFKDLQKKKPKSARNSKQVDTKDRSLSSRSKKEGIGLDFVDAFGGLSRVLGKKMFFIIDAVDCILDTDRVDFISGLLELKAQEDIHLQVLIASRPKGRIFNQIAHHGIRQIPMDEYNGRDIDTFLAARLRDIPGLSQSERDEAREKVLEKSSNKFKVVVQVAIPFLEQPFARPLSTRLKDLPDDMNDSYVQHSKSLAPNYLALLKTALTWTLTSMAPVPVNEIMDAYMGIYLSEEVDNELSEDATRDHSELYAIQIRDAGGPFLHVEKSSTKWVVRLKDPSAVKEFCFRSQNEKALTATAGAESYPCPRCRADLKSPQPLVLSKATCHLEMAITCLQHLNSPLFQKRYMPIHIQEVKLATEVETEPQEQVLIEEGDSEKQQEACLINREPETKHSQDEEVDDEADEKTTIEQADDDQSQDSEDRGIDGWAQNLIDGSVEPQEVDESGNLNEAQARYEIVNWYFHVREAQSCWDDVQRKDDQRWAFLQEQLEEFTTKSPLVFDAWRSAWFEGATSWSPLHVASLFGLVELAAKLLDGGADIHKRTVVNESALHFATWAPNASDMFKLLLSRGADPNFEREETALSAFHYCLINNSDYDCVRELLKHGAACSHTSQFGWNAIHYLAYFAEDPKLLDLLLDNENDPSNRSYVNTRDAEGETPLHKLMARPKIPVPLLTAFIDRGADVNEDDQDSERPLYEAAHWGENEAIGLLLRKVTEIDDDNKFGRTALHGAAGAGRAETVKLLLKHKADPNKTDKHNRTPLFFACQCSMAKLSDSERTANTLLEQLIGDKYPVDEINKVTLNGRTPLREAAAHGFIQVVETILGLIPSTDKETINRADTKKGRTALHCAALRGRDNVVPILLQHGADVTLRDTKDKKTALQLCYEHWSMTGTARYEEVLLTLIDHDPSGAANSQELLAAAAINGSVKILEKLLDLKADLNKPDQYGWTPLVLAQQYQRTEAASFLSRRIAQVGTRPSAWTYNYPVRWTQISDDGCSLVHTSGRRLCIMANHPVPAGLGKYYYEIEISKAGQDVGGPDLDNPILAIGFCTSSAHLLVFPGWPKSDVPNSRSWAYHGDDGGLFSSSSSGALRHLPRFGPGDVIGCGLNDDEKKIFYTKNGQLIEDFAFENVRGRLFPLLGLEDKVALSTNFGDNLASRAFKWNPEASSAVMSAKQEPKANGITA